MSRFDEILSRKMTRKEFLATLGMILIGLLGFPTIMGILSGKGSGKTKTGYGTGAYGGGDTTSNDLH